VLLFALCGLRLSEVARMRVQDVEAESRTLRVRGKGNRSSRAKLRTVAVPDTVWKKLLAYQRVRPQPGQQYLWISWTGVPLRPAGINKLVHARIRQAGLSDAVSPHGLRATCASLYVKRGMDPYSLKTLLGHESLKTTMDHYTRLTEEELREVWKRSNPLAGYDDE
jgi:site-specific recombinase XerD